jgi:hypothetical protein
MWIFSPIGHGHDATPLRHQRPLQRRLCFREDLENTLYLKVDDASRGEYEAHTLGYQTAGKDRALKSYLEGPATILEDDERLRSMPGRPTGHPIDRRNQSKGLANAKQWVNGAGEGNRTFL